MYRNRDWTMRRHALERFINAARTIIYRIRAERRLTLIRAVLAEANFDRINLARLVADDARMANSRRIKETTNMLDDAIEQPIDIDNILAPNFPMYRESDFRNRKTVDVQHVDNFTDLDQLKLEVPHQWQVLGYRHEHFPSVPAHYLPTEQDRQLRKGAEEEESIRGPRAIPMELDPITVPKAVWQPVQLPGKRIFKPNPELHTYTPSLATTEVDSDYILRPYLNVKYEPVVGVFTTGTLNEPLGSNSIKAMENQQVLTDGFLKQNENQLSQELYSSSDALQTVSNRDAQQAEEGISSSSSKIKPSREVNIMMLGNIVLPELMDGPESDDDLSDSDEEDDYSDLLHTGPKKERLTAAKLLRVPTQDWLSSQFFIPDEEDDVVQVQAHQRHEWRRNQVKEFYRPVLDSKLVAAKKEQEDKQAVEEMTEGQAKIAPLLETEQEPEETEVRPKSSNAKEAYSVPLKVNELRNKDWEVTTPLEDASQQLDWSTRRRLVENVKGFERKMDMVNQRIQNPNLKLK
eukprot:TRINITY_DN32313_c0_g1_i1.p1 TRINITY_DN32313_c0_g1~~TRINITY_DN32313_c0_g1_i1.p1  ORF type:complete len:593 (-),score=229.89 TRINITY_DN32313_c0_g1_i1:21-1577(-)